MIGTFLEGCDKVFSVPQRVKEETTKLAIALPRMIKEYNPGKGGVDIKYEKMAAQKISKKMSYVIRQG